MIGDYKNSSTGKPQTPTIDNDTGGIKVTPTALPAGEATIGKVDQGAPGLPAAPWPVLIVNALGAALGLALDATVGQIRDKLPTLVLGRTPVDPSGVTS